MKKLLTIICFLFCLNAFSQTNSIITEYYLSNNFTPLSGITPGSDNTKAMSATQTLARYNCYVNGVTTTGNRIPSQKEIIPIINLGYSFWMSSNPITFDISKGNILLLSIWSSSDRGGGTPTINSNNMTKIGVNNNTELWYIYTTISGNTTISIPNPNSVTILATGGTATYYGNISLLYSGSNSGTNTITSTVNVTQSKFNLIFRSNGINGSGIPDISYITHSSLEANASNIVYGTQSYGSCSFFSVSKSPTTSTVEKYTTITSGTATIDEVSAVFYVY